MKRLLINLSFRGMTDKPLMHYSNSSVHFFVLCFPLDCNYFILRALMLCTIVSTQHCGKDATLHWMQGYIEFNWKNGFTGQLPPPNEASESISCTLLPHSYYNFLCIIFHVSFPWHFLTFGSFVRLYSKDMGLYQFLSFV